MTSYTFRPAKREKVNLLIGIASGTGGGKTYSAMSMAQGICGDQPFAVIDTENGRARHYADMFRFDVCDLREPFTPDSYAEAITAADKAGYKAIVVDSMSHEWAGEGGVLDMQEEELERMAGTDWGRRESCKMASWIKPKKAHKKFVNAVLQVNANLILCFRAEAKIEMVKDGGKWAVVPKKSLVGLDGWLPICDQRFPFELTVSFLLMADAPGMPRPIKLQEQHKHLFPLDRPLNAESGRLVSLWAEGGQSAKPKTAKKGPFDVKAALTHFHQQGVTSEQVVARLGHPVSESDRATLGKWYQDLVEHLPWPGADEGGDPVPDDPPASEEEEGFGS